MFCKAHSGAYACAVTASHVSDYAAQQSGAALLLVFLVRPSNAAIDDDVDEHVVVHTFEVARRTLVRAHVAGTSVNLGDASAASDDRMSPEARAFLRQLQHGYNRGFARACTVCERARSMPC
jgi:hypothetical protein